VEKKELLMNLLAKPLTRKTQPKILIKTAQLKLIEASNSSQDTGETPFELKREVLLIQELNYL